MRVSPWAAAIGHLRATIDTRSDPVPHYSMLTRAYPDTLALTFAAYAVTNTGCKACEPTLPIEMTAGGTEDPVDPIGTDYDDIVPLQSIEATLVIP